MEEEKQELLEEIKPVEVLEEKQEVLEKVIKPKKKSVKKIKKKIILEESKPLEILDDEPNSDDSTLYYFILAPIVCYTAYELGKYIKSKYSKKRIILEK